MAQGRKQTARTRPVSLAVIGDIDHTDFSAARRWLEPHQVQYFADRAAAAAHFAAEPAPPWLLVFTAARSEVSQKWIERLHRRAPFSKIIHICGSWCEGETRSGRALAGVPRVYWHQFESRATAVWLNGVDYAGWSLPRTATPLDALQQRGPGMRGKPTMTLGIVSDRRDDFQALSDSAIACGYSARRWRPSDDPASVAAILWDCQSFTAKAQRQLQDLLQNACGRPLLAILDFPRHCETEQVLALGAAAVLSKPLLLGDLREALRRCFEGAMPKLSRQAG